MSEDTLPVPMQTSFEVALDHETDGVAGPVHDGPGVLLPLEGVVRHAVIPAQFRSVTKAREHYTPHFYSACHHCGYHAVRSPGYAVVAVWYSMRGAYRLAGNQVRWWWLAEAAELRKSADAGDFLRLHEHTRQVRRTRGLVLLGELAVLGVGSALIAMFGSALSEALVAAAAFFPLVFHGRPKGKPLVKGAVTKPRLRLINSDVVLRAYYAAGLGNADKKDQQVTFAPPGLTRDGQGSRVVVDLPFGKTLDDAMKSKGAIASGLDVSLSQVFISRDSTSHRRHVLWVADRDPLAVASGRTPMLSCKPTDVWKPVPFGLDERGRLVELPLMWNSLLVSALPRQGKTFSARLPALYAALDPYVKLGVFDFKGSPDWRKFSLVADSYGFGLTPMREGLPLDIFIDTLQKMKRDVQARYARLSELPADICPEGKLTREIARDPRYGMPVRMLVMDEFQEVYDLGEASKEIASLLTFMIKVAPAAGVILVGSTQRPTGVGSGQVATAFTGFRDNFAVRFGLRTSSWQVSEVCLGAGAYSEGLDTSTLLPEHKGVGILRGASDVSPTVRTYLADSGDTEKILTAARGLREAAGTLSGMAAGEHTSEPPRDVLGDLMSVFDGDAGLHWAEAAQRLSGAFPARWSGITGESLSADCRNLGVPSVDVKRSGVTLKGVRRSDLVAVAPRMAA